MNNDSRIAFTHSPYTHPRGIWLQSFFKPLIIKTIKLMHSYIKSKYDEEAFIFDDIRLKHLKQFTEQYFKENMEQRKQDILNPAMDLFLFFMKEDIFYRSRFFDMIQRYNHVPGITSIEMQNLKDYKGG